MTINSCDWLSGSGTLTKEFPLQIGSEFTSVKQKLSTRVYSEWWQIKRGEFPVMDVLCKPTTPILQPDSCHFKLYNAELYRHHGAESEANYFDVFGISYAKPTRVDVCTDFNLFVNKLKPQSFITQIVRGLILRKHGGRFKVEGTQSRTPLWHYLRYGSHSSPVSMYLYNKTKELKEAKNKPWIVKLWEIKGLDLSQDVWRLEFSITDSRLRFLNQSTGEENSLHNFSHLKKSHINNLFQSCLNRYGTFVRNDWKKNISRMKQIELLLQDSDRRCIYLAQSSFENSNLHKFNIKQLVQMENDLRLIRQLNTNHINLTISNYEKRFNLEGYSSTVTGQ